MRALFTLLLTALLALPAQAADDIRGLKAVATDKATQQQGEVKLYDKSYAVIIGIDQYANLPPDRQLKLAVRDAQGVEATLKRHYKFDRIVHLYNQEATRARILDVLTDELPQKMGENDALFVFFAGHGDQIKSRNGDVGYLIPHDGQVGKLSSVISMADLRDTVSKAVPAKHVFYVIDACYGGLLTATRAIDKNPRRDLAYLKEIAKEPVRQVLTAGGKGEEVLDGGPDGHSVFTGRLIEVLEKAGDFITANEIQAILRERVYGDARARNHTQTPAYGALSGSGDFVFVPSLEQKTQDNRAEIARLEAELKKLESDEARAQENASRTERERRQRELEAARRAAEGKLKAEQLRQQQLASEQAQQQAAAAERQRLLTAQRDDEKRLAELKAAAAARRQQTAAPSGEFPTLDAAVTEIRRLEQEIRSIESRYEKELSGARKRVEQRYGQQLAALDAERKDEFETQTDFKSRIARQREELQGQRQSELARLNVAQLAEAEITPLKARIQNLAEREYSVGADYLVDLGSYDPDGQRFPVTLRPKAAGSNDGTLRVTGDLRLPPAEARKFKQQWSAGLVRADVSATFAQGAKLASLVNDADVSRRDAVDGMFMTGEEREERERRITPETVRIPGRDYELGKTEVTQAQWRAVMGNDPSRFKGCDDCPVEQVSWNDVQEYLNKLNQMTGKQYRLPTEAEWKHACDGGESHEYCGGDNLDALGWYGGNSGNKTHPVGQKRANGYGLYDMSGNVWEWMQDCYDGNCSERVLRGGSWNNSSGNARAANRYGNTPTGRFNDYGFRVARSARTN